MVLAQVQEAKGAMELTGSTCYEEPHERDCMQCHALLTMQEQ